VWEATTGRCSRHHPSRRRTDHRLQPSARSTPEDPYNNTVLDYGLSLRRAPVSSAAPCSGRDYRNAERVCLSVGRCVLVRTHSPGNSCAITGAEPQPIGTEPRVGSSQLPPRKESVAKSAPCNVHGEKTGSQLSGY
jgi:hypothetical protein